METPIRNSAYKVGILFLSIAKLSLIKKCIMHSTVLVLNYNSNNNVSIQHRVMKYYELIEQ